MGSKKSTKKEAKAIRDAVNCIDDRASVLTAELERLWAAKRELIALLGDDPGTVVPSVHSLSVTSQIEQALLALGPADTGQVCRYVLRKRPDAKRSSIRAMLSIGKKEGRYSFSGTKWSRIVE